MPPQSVHFANGNPAKSMKTSHGKNFNRYTLPAFQAPLFLVAAPVAEPRAALAEGDAFGAAALRRAGENFGSEPHLRYHLPFRCRVSNACAEKDGR
jgi:hypothetical protein